MSADLDLALREAIERYVYEHGMNADLHAPTFTAGLLARRFPPACQTCHGDGKADGTIHTRHGVCPDCPTLGDLLSWGRAVATTCLDHDGYRAAARQGIHSDREVMAFRVGRIDLLAALKGEHR